ncbi:M48 family metalloprotease [Desulfobaculum bizertense]|uniref:Putative Zn-dependent protease, contains TPR repeats n=1 Tax=Desulfobaculum bizertense DSM 18034 TaxID=1121442 RepID=A0A1T4VXP5_9BACT|nr:M48 family metalloprotease [Desulfobaculum bizertense]SKA69764.1 Putative Zn-dependent protease, contains TPR repeats [Desulfobaculum bizertense DSM 18034]
MLSDMMNRREFLYLSGITSAVFLAGCAINPVTGEQQLMFVSPQQEIALDKKSSPHQFSSDYGATSDKKVNAYVSRTGLAMARHTHRPDMPYSFRCVDAVYVNAYAFPGGSIACTRGILLTLQNEAELSALLGHEMGHVNARHTASRMSKGMLISAVAAGVSAFAATKRKEYAAIAAGLGGAASGALLAFYSREDERQADSLGMQYMVRTGYSPSGMVGLQTHLLNMHKSRPNPMQILFASHPMSEERVRNAELQMDTEFLHDKNKPLYRERYMDNTASLRAKRKPIMQLQDGEKLMQQKKYPQAEQKFSSALKAMPNDYAGLLMMSKCTLAQNKAQVAQSYADKAKRAKPGEAQALHMAGISRLVRQDFSGAEQQFRTYEQRLPGNPNTVYLRGLSLEGMGKKEAAAQEYGRYLQSGAQGDMAKRAYRKLQNWGYIRQR